MQSEFEMSMLGEMTHFLWLQISQQDKGIFIYQTQVHQRSAQEIPDGRLQASPYPHDNRLKVKLIRFVKGCGPKVV